MAGSAFSATRWVIISSFGYRILAYFGQVFILRLVSKEIFGAYSTFVDLLLLTLPFLPFSFDALLIKEKRFRKRYQIALSQALGLLGLAVMLTLGLTFVFPQPGVQSLAGSFGEEDISFAAKFFVFPVLAVITLKLSIRSLLAADLNFKRISIGEFGNGMITWIGGALGVLIHPAIESLLLAYLIGEFFECVWMYRGFPFRPFSVLNPSRWLFIKYLFGKHRKFCITNTLDLSLNNLSSSIPGPLIFTLLSESAAADFRVSRLLIQLPILLLVGSIWRVAYPTLAGISNLVLHDRCLRIIGTTAGFLVPAVLWLAVFAPVTAYWVGGDKYLSAAPLIQWMSIYMVLVAIFSPIGSLDMIRDKPEVGLYWNIAHTLARIVVIVVATPFGLVATIAAMSVVSLLFWGLWAYTLQWLLGAPARTFFGAVLKFFPGWLVLGAIYYLVDYFSPGYSLWGAAASILPSLLYIGCMFRLFPRESEMIYRLLGKERTS